jgi:SAM-dependent methyltransferase
MNQFDIVICMRDVLNYCYDHFEKALDNLCSVVRKDGYLILSVGTTLHYSLSQKPSFTNLRTLIEGYGVYEGMRVKLFSKEEIEKALRKRKFEIVELGGGTIFFSLLPRKLQFQYKKLKSLEVLERYLISKNPNLAEHLIVVAKKS